MTNYDNYGGYADYGRPRLHDPQVKRAVSAAISALHRGDLDAALDAIGRMVTQANASSHNPDATQPPAPTGDGTERGRPAADRSTQ